MSSPRSEPSETLTIATSHTAVDPIPGSEPEQSGSPVYYGPVDERSWLHRKRDRWAAEAEVKGKAKEEKKAKKARTRVWTDETGRQWVARGYGPIDDLRWISEPIYGAGPSPRKTRFPFKYFYGPSPVGSDAEEKACSRSVVREDWRHRPIRAWIRGKRRAWIAEQRANLTPEFLERLSRRRDARRATKKVREQRTAQAQKSTEEQPTRRPSRQAGRDSATRCEAETSGERADIVRHTLTTDSNRATATKQMKQAKKVDGYKSPTTAVHDGKQKRHCHRRRDHDELSLPDVGLMHLLPANTAYTVSVSYDPELPPVPLVHPRKHCAVW